MSKVSTIRNIGPKSEAGFARAGLHTAEDVQEIGPDEAYKRLVKAGTRPHFIGYYALVMGLQGRPWNDCAGDEKAMLRERFDALISEASSRDRGRSKLEAELNRLGVISED